MEIRQAKNAKDLELASQVISAAFMNYPSVCFLFPKEETRRRFLAIFYRRLLQFAFQFGKVLIAADSDKIIGTATYIQSSQADQTILRMLSTGLISLPFLIPLGTTMRSLQLSLILDRARHEFAAAKDIYVSYVAVDPQFQRKGICRTLMQNIFREAESQGVNCYLETHSSQNVEMYGRYGFAVVGKRKATPNAPENDIHVSTPSGLTQLHSM